MQIQDLTANYKDIPKGIHLIRTDGKKQFMTSNEYKKILKNQNIEVQSMKLKEIVSNLNPGQQLTKNATGYVELANALQGKLDAMDNEERVHNIEEIYQDYLVYRVTNDQGTQTYKRSYSVSEDGTVELGNDATEVVKKVDYVTVQEGLKTNYIEGQQPLLPPGVQPVEETVVNNISAEQQVEEFEETNNILLNPQDRRTMVQNIRKKQESQQVASGKTKESQEEPLLPIGVEPVK